MAPHGSSNKGKWLWSEEQRKYYRFELDGNGGYLRDGAGQYIYEWDKRSSGSGGQQTENHVQSAASAGSDCTLHGASNYTLDNQPQETSSFPTEVPSEYISGTPGDVEELDSRYTVKFGQEEHRFFKQGRVFAMLWTETAGETHRRRARTGTENSMMTTQRYSNDAISQGRFGQDVYSQIRRFVIVRVNRRQHFVLACAITTYGQRGVLKGGCNAQEHTIVHLRNRPAYPLPGEYEKGMTKEALMIDPTDPAEEMSPISRLRLGKVVSIECNVKVRDIGMIAREHRSKLLEYYQQEQDTGFEPDEYEVETLRSNPAPPPFTHGGYGTTASAAQGAYYAPTYNTYPAGTHGLYPSHSGHHHGETQAHQNYPAYHYAGQQQPQYQNPAYQYQGYQHGQHPPSSS